MRILFVHNSYQSLGGEDSVVESEINLLRQHGHEVTLLTRHNDDIKQMNPFRLLMQTLWSRSSSREINQIIKEFKPTLVHVHNTFPLISPSIYWVVCRAGVALVQTLHNFRLCCPNGCLLRQSRVCEDCLGRLPWRAIPHRCYRNSVIQTTVLSAMLVAHRALGTWKNKIPRYIALNDFCRNKFIQGGLPANKISVKPNFIDIPQDESAKQRLGFLFVGRISKEKGTHLLATVFSQLPETSLTIIGSGPDSMLFQPMGHVKLTGFLRQDQITYHMRQSSALILPSLCFENFPRTIIEAFACFLPVIASNHGAMSEIIRDGETGLLFDPGNPVDLAAKVHWAQENPCSMQRMGLAARSEYEQKFTGERNYYTLMTIYHEAIDETSNRH